MVCCLYLYGITHPLHLEMIWDELQILKLLLDCEQVWIQYTSSSLGAAPHNMTADHHLLSNFPGWQPLEATPSSD